LRPRAVLASSSSHSSRSTLHTPRSFANPHGSFSAHHHHRPVAMAVLDSDEACPERAGDRRPACGERGCASHGVDRTAGEGPAAQPVVRLRRQFHPFPRARLRGADESLHARAVLPLRRGVAQLHAERDFASGDVRQRVRGLPGDPSVLGSLGSSLPRGAARARYAGAEDTSRGARRRHDDHVAERAQGALRPLHDDFQQRGVGAGVVLPTQ
jgi:hypothetical protein